MYWSKHRDIYFVEGSPPGADRLQPINTELNRIFSQNHLKTLDDLKDRMAEHAASVDGCNAVIEFKYGQRSSFLKSILGMDNVLWFGSGCLAAIRPDELTKSTSG